MILQKSSKNTVRVNERLGLIEKKGYEQKISPKQTLFAYKTCKTHKTDELHE